MNDNAGQGQVTADEPNVLVASMGGVGSTMFMDFLARDLGLLVNDPHGPINPTKHAVFPPWKPGLHRAVFLFGCPYDSLLSLFRRGYAAAYFATVSGGVGEDVSWPSDPWEETCRRFDLHRVGTSNKWVDGSGRHASEIGALDWFREHKRWVQEERRSTLERIERVAPFRDLEDYLVQGVDTLRRIEQFRRWKEQPAPYPILLVRYETLWHHLPEIFDFLGVAHENLSAFPSHRPRASDHRTLPRHRLRLLRQMYGDLDREIRAHPDVVVR